MSIHLGSNWKKRSLPPLEDGYSWQFTRDEEHSCEIPSDIFLHLQASFVKLDQMAQVVLPTITFVSSTQTTTFKHQLCLWELKHKFFYLRWSKVSESRSVTSNSLWPHGLYIHTVHGILQARVLEWVAILFSRGSSQPRSCIAIHIAGGFFTSTATREAQDYLKLLSTVTS